MNEYFYILLLILILVISSMYINPRHLVPKKEVKNNDIREVLIALPTIDRDYVLIQDFYDRIDKSIHNTKNVNFSFLVTTRVKDIKMINFYTNIGDIIDEDVTVKIFDNYEIEEDKRHNMNEVSKAFNYIKNYASEKNYDSVIIIESDILVNENSISKLLDSQKNSHVSLFPFETPWAGYPVVMSDSLVPELVDSRSLKNKNKSGDIPILGHGTGCMIMNKQVIDDENINFDTGTYGKIKGQDVGFFWKLNKYLYKVSMINEELFHAYEYVKSLKNDN